MVTPHTDAPEPSAKPISMGDKQFRLFSDFIHGEFGIKLPPSKKTMLEARLQKRLRVLGMRDYKEYCDFLFSPAGMDKELFFLVNAVTTNTTDFFREPRHFEVLFGKILPEYYNRSRNEPFAIWSAGCSSGEEPYTMAMVLSEFAAQNPGFRYSVLATDISVEVLEKAMRAVYTEEKVAPVPNHMKKKYLLRSKDHTRRLVRVVKDLRESITFDRLNFMEEFDLKISLNVIFCRNVVIYFDRPTQERLFNKFCRHLKIGGHLFIGHSESLAGMTLPLEQVAPTVYRRV
jgi:chemotaxis protein methyltransferase CheR